MHFTSIIKTIIRVGEGREKVETEGKQREGGENRERENV
jgi:hypothetical protein